MDRYDQAIIRVLELDARISWTKLAEQVSLSPSATQRRVEALVEDGVIEKFTLCTNANTLGFSVKAFVAVNVERQDTDKAQALRKFLIQHHQVQSVHMISGSIDFMLEVVARNLEDLARFLDDELLPMSGVRDATSSIVMRVVKAHQPVTEIAIA